MKVTKHIRKLSINFIRLCDTGTFAINVF